MITSPAACAAANDGPAVPPAAVRMPLIGRTVRSWPWVTIRTRGPPNTIVRARIVVSADTSTVAGRRSVPATIRPRSGTFCVRSVRSSAMAANVGAILARQSPPTSHLASSPSSTTCGFAVVGAAARASLVPTSSANDAQTTRAFGPTSGQFSSSAWRLLPW